MVSNKAVPEDLNLQFRSKFNHGLGFTNHGRLQCAILKDLYGLKEKRTHKSVFFQKIQNEIFEILNIFKINMKFTRVAY